MVFGVPDTAAGLSLPTSHTHSAGGMSGVVVIQAVASASFGRLRMCFIVWLAVAQAAV